MADNWLASRISTGPRAAFRQRCAKLASSSAYDALLIADSGRIALQVVPQIRKAGGANVRILGTELWNTEGSLAQNPAMHGAWFASVSDGLYNQLSTKYRARLARPRSACRALVMMQCCW